MDRRKGPVYAVGSLLLGLTLCALIAKDAYDDYRLTTNGANAVGEVVDQDKDSKGRARCLYQYTVAGQPYTLLTHCAWPKDQAITYWRPDPSLSRLPGDQPSTFAYIVLSFFGLSGVGIGLVELRASRLSREP
jgi:hypothetical protein